MPYFYDLNREATATTSETTHVAGKAGASQPTLGIFGVIGSARSTVAGGGSIRSKTNTNGGTVFSGGTAFTPLKKNTSNPAAQSTWVTDASAITAGSTAVTRGSVGFAQTGGTGGLQPIMQQAAYQLQCTSAANSPPVDFELTSITSTATQTLAITLEIGEDI